MKFLIGVDMNLEAYFGSILVVFIIFALTYFIGRYFKNYAIVDSIWAYTIFIQTLSYILFAHKKSTLNLFYLAMLGAWAIRLGTFLMIRIVRKHPVVDSRYVHLEKAYGDNANLRFALFFVIQAVVVLLMSFPFIYFSNHERDLEIVDYVLLSFFSIFLLMESLADQQMSAFKAKSENQNKVCDLGLWYYSRHPNYFFESMIWWVFFAAFALEGMWWSIYLPLMMLCLLLKVSGVPLSEEQAILKRGKIYADYQRRTSYFIPWFKSKK